MEQIIKGVCAYHKLKIIDHPKGDIYKGLSIKDSDFRKFGEVYFSRINYGEVKGWKKHLSMTCSLISPEGEAKVVIYDESSKIFHSFQIGKKNYSKLVIHPNNWFAFKGLSKESALIMNFADIPHDPEEALNVSLDYFDYSWD